MAKRVGSGPAGPEKEVSSDGRSVVDLADARVRLRSKNPTNEALIEELDEVRSLLDQGLSTRLEHVTSLIAAARNNPTVLALALRFVGRSRNARSYVNR